MVLTFSTFFRRMLFLALAVALLPQPVMVVVPPPPRTANKS